MKGAIQLDESSLGRTLVGPRIQFVWFPFHLSREWQSKYWLLSPRLSQGRAQDPHFGVYIGVLIMSGDPVWMFVGANPKLVSLSLSLSQMWRRVFNLRSRARSIDFQQRRATPKIRVIFLESLRKVRAECMSKRLRKYQSLSILLDCKKVPKRCDTGETDRSASPFLSFRCKSSASKIPPHLISLLQSRLFFTSNFR